MYKFLSFVELQVAKFILFLASWRFFLLFFFLFISKKIATIIQAVNANRIWNHVWSDPPGWPCTTQHIFLHGFQLPTTSTCEKVKLNKSSFEKTRHPSRSFFWWWYPATWVPDMTEIWHSGFFPRRNRHGVPGLGAIAKKIIVYVQIGENSSIYLFMTATCSLLGRYKTLDHGEYLFFSYPNEVIYFLICKRKLHEKFDGRKQVIYFFFFKENKHRV